MNTKKKITEAQQAVFQHAKVGTYDTWLAPPELLQALGSFDLDVCCPATMPWSTAKRMIHLPEDGLTAKWRGRVWCNPPYSAPMAWIDKLAEHGNGVMLLPANTAPRYGQRALEVSDAVYFLKGRLLFHFVDGSKSKGKWLDNMLVAKGAKNVKALQKLSQNPAFPGVLMVRA